MVQYEGDRLKTSALMISQTLQFEKDIRPLLGHHMFSCHDATTIKIS